MKRFPNVQEAKQQIIELKKFVELAEEYEPRNLREQAIKLYAATFSIKQVTDIINSQRASKDLSLIDAKFVSETIQSTPSDDQLHVLVRRVYLQKTKHIRKKFPQKSKQTIGEGWS